MADSLLDLLVRESKPGGPWGHKFVLRLRARDDTLVWDVKTAILKQKPGYDPAGARLYFRGVPMANCRTLADYHVGTQSTLQIMRGAQGCVEAGKSCICATQLQHVLAASRKQAAQRDQADQAEQAQRLALLVSASSRQASLNRVLLLQVESAILLASSRSVHHTESALAAVQIADRMVQLGADVAGAPPPAAVVGAGVSGVTADEPVDNPQQLFRRLAAVLYPRFRKWPPLMVKLAALLDVKPPRRREDETDVDAGLRADESGLDVVDGDDWAGTNGRALADAGGGSSRRTSSGGDSRTRRTGVSGPVHSDASEDEPGSDVALTYSDSGEAAELTYSDQ